MRLTIHVFGAELLDLHLRITDSAPDPPPDGDHLAGIFDFGFTPSRPPWSPLRPEPEERAHGGWLGRAP